MKTKAPAYAELQTSSNFSFLHAASHPDELVLAAKMLKHAALGLADRNSLAGVVRAHVAAKNHELRLLVGAHLLPEDGGEVLCYPTDRAAYGRLCRLLTLGRRRAEKGVCRFTFAELLEHSEGQILIALPELGATFPEAALRPLLQRMARHASGRCYLAAQMLHRGEDVRRLERLADLAEEFGTPLVATNAVLYHRPERKALMDVITCIREGVTIDTAGYLLEGNAERHLKSPQEMARLFAGYPEALTRTLEIAERCRFSLDELRYEYPEELGEQGEMPQEALERETWRGARERYSQELPAGVRATLKHELDLIRRLDYAPYFLTVNDIVRFARGRGILCQGRGSAANSAVCYCLGITAVDPARVDLLFERFISEERNEPPDIDVDFEHERREEVIQYIYGKYGRVRAGLTATVIHYRARRALREVGKAMGLSADMITALAGAVWGWGQEGVAEAQVRELGFDPEESRLAMTLALTREIIGFPRHLSQHVGGFVITRGPLSELVPIENAAMDERTVIQWDKDDIDALGILKVDVLALGMLSCLRRGFALLEQHLGKRFDLASVPAEDPAVYDMLCKADSLGVFQVESRAQMTMLPRLKPRDFYDLVIEVAIVRPGPIQGDMVHPYLRRRNGLEKVSYPSEALRSVLGKTLGVPLFQEQAMKIAIVAAGFTPGEADGLRRAMATFRRVGTIHTFRDKMISGMCARGYDRDFAERCFRQIEGFGTYGFPESHAASFALLVYVSAWMKCHHPAVFACALLNSQPMGFYAPAQIVRDAREHGVEVRPIDVNASGWDCTLEPAKGGGLALRLGFRQITGMAEAEALRLVARRGNGYPDPLTLWRNARVKASTLENLARADAFASLGLERRQALWAVKGLPADPLPLFAWSGEEERGAEGEIRLPPMSESEAVVEDYRSLRLSLRSHPVSFLRQALAREGIRACSSLAEVSDGASMTVAGLVLVRQRPGTAKGVIFITLEDETGIANLVIWPDLFERQRRSVLGARLLAAAGRVQREGTVIHLVARHLIDMTPRLSELETRPRDLFMPASEEAKENRAAASRTRLFSSRDFH